MPAQLVADPQRPLEVQPAAHGPARPARSSTASRRRRPPRTSRPRPRPRSGSSRRRRSRRRPGCCPRPAKASRSRAACRRPAPSGVEAADRADRGDDAGEHVRPSRTSVSMSAPSARISVADEPRHRRRATRPERRRRRPPVAAHDRRAHGTRRSGPRARRAARRRRSARPPPPAAASARPRPARPAPPPRSMPGSAAGTAISRTPRLAQRRGPLGVGAGRVQEPGRHVARGGDHARHQPGPQVRVGDDAQVRAAPEAGDAAGQLGVVGLHRADADHAPPSCCARSACAARRASGPVIHWLSPLRVAIRPSSVVASFSVTIGRPCRTRVRKPCCSASASACEHAGHHLDPGRPRAGRCRRRSPSDRDRRRRPRPGARPPPPARRRKAASARDGARLERDVGGGPARGLAGHRPARPLRMRPPARRRDAAPGRRPPRIVAHQHAPHGRIRPGAAEPTPGQRERRPHVLRASSASQPM